MKLYREKPTPPRTGKAIEALTPEVTDRKLFFDPNKEIPSELFARNRELLSEPEVGDVDQIAVISGAWYGMINPEYRRSMRDSAWLKESWLQYFRDSYFKAVCTHPIGNQVMEIRSCVDLMASFVQVFPESRADMLALGPNLYDWMVERYGPAKDFLDFNTLVVLLEIWPEKKEAVMQLYFPDGPPTQIQKPNTKWDLSPQLLVFPELRLKADQYLAGAKPEYQTELAYWKEQVKTGQDGVTSYHDYLKNLAILGAESAWIDETGGEHIELARVATMKIAPLPARPEV